MPGNLEVGGRGDGETISRRDFLNYFLGGGTLALIFASIYPVIRYIFPPKGAEVVTTSVAAAGVDELQPNSAKVFKFGNKPAMLIHTAEGKFKAFSAVCTHLNCTVQYNADSASILCACHNGHFDLNGQVISGPPPKGLEEFRVDVRDDQILVSRI